MEIVKVNDASIQTILETIGQILQKESGNFQDFIVNIGSANKHLTCAGVTAAFVHGIKAFDVMSDRADEFCQ